MKKYSPFCTVVCVLLTVCFQLPAQNCTVVNVDFLGPNDGHMLNVCDSEAPVELMDFAEQSGGLFIGQGVIDNVLHPALAPLGNSSIHYLLNGDTCTTELKVIASEEQATFLPVQNNFCFDDPAVEIPVAPSQETDATFININNSFTFLENAMYDPSLHGSGTDTLVYKFLEINGSGCQSFDTLLVHVSEAMEAPQFVTQNQTICSSAEDLLLEASPAGGVFHSSTAVLEGNRFRVSASPLGEHLIVYEFSDADGICIKYDSLLLTIQDGVALSFELALSQCEKQADTLRYTGTDLNEGMELVWTLNPPQDIEKQENYALVNWKYPGDYSVELSATNKACSSQGLNENTKLVPDRMDNICRNVLFIPNTFSPNGDELNDTFCPLGENIHSIQWSVYDRWGTPLFYTDEINGAWDGTYQGKASPTGTYFYTAEVQFEDGEIKNKRGDISIIR